MKFFLCFIPMVWAASIAVACEGHQASLDLRDAIYSYEIDRVETMLSDVTAAQDAFDTRCLYSHFQVMRPNTAEFVTHWLDRHPGSPEAKAAKALILLKFSQSMRGSRPASVTYLGALVEARQMMDEARRLAINAKAERPGLIPALDVMDWLDTAERNGAFFEPDQAELAVSIRYEDAGEALRHAPLDPQLVRSLSARAATPAERLDYAERLLIAAPYYPAHWQAYLAAQMAVRPISYAEGEPYRVNQVVFANHSPQALRRYVLDKLNAMKAGDHALSASDLTNEILCPAIRAIRLHRHVCSLARDAGCEMSQDVADDFEQLVQDAGTQGLCFDLRNLPARALKFEPMDIPELTIKTHG